MSGNTKQYLPIEEMFIKLKAGSEVGRQFWDVEPSFDLVYLKYLSVNNKPVIIMYGLIEGIIIKADVWQPDQSDIVANDWYVIA